MYREAGAGENLFPEGEIRILIHYSGHDYRENRIELGTGAFLNPGPDGCLGERFTGLESCDAHLVFIQDLSGIFQYALIVINDHDPFRQSDHRLFPMLPFL